MIFVVFFFFLQSSNSFNIISKYCKEVSNNDPNLEYDFCVASLEDASSKLQPPPTNLETLVEISIQLTKSNGTNVLSIISKFLKDKRFDTYRHACLQDCSKLYSDSLSNLDRALVALKSKDFDTAATMLSSSMDSPNTCEEQFNEKKGEKSPLTKKNQVYSQLNLLSLVLLQMFHKQHH